MLEKRKIDRGPRSRAPNGAPRSFFFDAVVKCVSEDCLIWPYARNSAGYGHFQVGDKWKVAHRLALTVVKGPPPTPGHFAAHSCGNGHLGCCNPKHLRWATPAENSKEMVLHGNSRKGVKHTLSKFTEIDVREIRASADKTSVIARRYGVSPGAITMIRNRKRWGHVE